MRVPLFPAAHGHIAEIVRDHEPGQAAGAAGFVFGPAVGSEQFTEPLDPLGCSSHAARRVRHPERRGEDQYELPRAAPAGPRWFMPSHRQAVAGMRTWTVRPELARS